MAEAISRQLYISILFCCLTYSIINSYVKLQNEPTAFEEHEVEYKGSFPSFTICPRSNDGSMDNFTNFKDVMDLLESFKEISFQANFTIGGKGVER